MVGVPRSGIDCEEELKEQLGLAELMRSLEESAALFVIVELLSEFAKVVQRRRKVGVDLQVLVEDRD